jgi:exonuclease III
MKIVTWNCQGAFARKAERIFSDAPDIAVIEECSKRATEVVAYEGYRARWFGRNANKGVGVFCRKDWKLRLLGQPEQTWDRCVESSGLGKVYAHRGVGMRGKVEAAG